MSDALTEVLQALPAASNTEHQATVSALVESLKAGEIEGLTNIPLPPLVHHFSNGVYGREIRMAAGTAVIGRIHKHACLNVIAAGKCTVTTGQGPIELEAPTVWVSEPGVQRVVYCHTDVVWITSHATDKTNVVEIESDMVVDTPQEYQAWLEQHTQEQLK